MHLSEIANTLNKALPALQLKSKVLQNHSGRPYYITGLIRLRETTLSLVHIPGIAPALSDLLDNHIFDLDADELTFTVEEYTELKAAISKIHDAITTITALNDETHDDSPETLKIKLPPLQDFDDLQKIVGQLKLALETPIKMSKENQNIQILRAEPGSIWLVVSLSLGAIALIKAITFLALEVRQRIINQNLMIKQSQAMGLKNDLLNGIKTAFQSDLKTYLDSKITEITNEHFAEKQESHKALQTSVSLFGDLYEKDLQISYSNEDANQNESSFPSIEQIENLSKIVKQIESK